MNLLKNMNDDTAVDWWNKNRKIANKIIDTYNLWQVGKETADNVLIEFAIGYNKLDIKNVDYSETFDIIRDSLLQQGLDVSFYKGF